MIFNKVTQPAFIHTITLNSVCHTFGVSIIYLLETNEYFYSARMQVKDEVSKDLYIKNIKVSYKVKIMVCIKILSNTTVFNINNKNNFSCAISILE